VKRDVSHPCIVAWVPINESWGVPDLLHDPTQRHFVEALYHLTKTLDPTRPVIANDGWEYFVGDMVGVHDYASDGNIIRSRYGSAPALDQTIREVQPGDRRIVLDGERPRETPIVLSEFGGIGYQPKEGEPWYGYGTVPDRAAYEAKLRELLEAVLDCPIVAGFCYTQLTDTAQETNGLLDERRQPKLDPEVVYGINRGEPGLNLPKMHRK
jgi:hypothetical protein